MGLRSMTHSFDANQRHVQLKIISDTGSDLVNEGPATSSWTPAGYYMLFLLTADRVPSVAKILQVK